MGDINVLSPFQEVTFTEISPYSRDRVLHGEGSIFFSVVFESIQAAVVVNYLPTTTKEIHLTNSPNITFDNSHFNVSTNDVILWGPAIKFNDAIFHLNECFVDHHLDGVLDLTLRNTQSLVLRHTKLHIDSLRNVSANEIYIYGDCIDTKNDGFKFQVPELAEGVHTIYILTDLLLAVHLTNIPNSLRIMTVGYGCLSEESLNLINNHSQRLRYLFGQPLQVFQINRLDYLDYPEIEPELMNFTRNDRSRDLNVAAFIDRRYYNAPDLVNSRIMEYVYGDYYGQPRHDGININDGTTRRKRKRRAIQNRKRKSRGRSRGKSRGRGK